MIPEILALLCYMRFRPCPKQGKKPKKKPKPIARKARFKLYDNPTKSYRLQPSEKIIAQAEKWKAEQIAKQWPAELAIKSMLDALSARYEHQRIMYRTGSFIICDFFIADRNLVVEADGNSHALQSGYDIGRDTWLLRQGIRTLRLTNKTILRTPAAAIAAIQATLANPR